VSRQGDRSRAGERTFALRDGLRPLVIALCSAAVLSTSADACPSAAAVGRGITLSSSDGRSATIAWLDANRVRLTEANPAAPKSFPRETVLIYGLLVSDTRSPSARSRMTFTTEAERIFPLAPGTEHEIAYASEVEGRPPLKGRMAIAVTEALQHKVGACTYDALLVARISEFENGQRTPIRYDVYVPALQAIVKSTMFDEANNAIVEQESFEFEAIAEK